MTTEPRRPRRRGLALVLGAQLLVAALLAVLLFSARPWALSDVSLYHRWSGLMLEGLIPYRDFFFDYPPLAVVPILAPRVVGLLQELTFGQYLVLFAACMVALAVILTVVVRAVVRSPDGEPHASRFSRFSRFSSFLVLMAVALPLLLVRFDLAPILLTALAMLATHRGRPVGAGVFLGLAIAAKLYAIVLVPVFAAWWWLRHDRRDALVHVGAVGLSVALAVLPFAIVAGSAALDTVQFQQQRGLQLESAAGGVIQLLNMLWPEGLEVELATTHELRSDRVTAYLDAQSWVALGLLAGAVVGAIQRLRSRGGTGPALSDLAGVTVAMLIAFMLTNRALSPQHVFWVVPFVPLLSRGHQLALIMVAVLTIALFPVLYADLVAQEAVPIGLLNLRNLLLAGVALSLLLARNGRATEDRGRVGPKEPRDGG